MFDPATETVAWKNALRRAGFAYFYSRVCVMIGAALVAAELRADANIVDEKFSLAPFADPDYPTSQIPKNAARPMLDVLTSWDGVWYLRLVRLGYPHKVLPDVNYNRYDARAAFFPAYPMLIKAVDRVLPGGADVASVVINLLLGIVVVYIAGLLARHLFDVNIGERTMVLMSLFPGSFVLSFAYAEALMLVCAGACLWFLLRRQWVLAGVAAALATATRPNGLALVAACAVAAFLAIRERREWRSLAAPLLAPLGFIGFQLWLGARTGERGVWFRVQTEAWGEGTSYGLTAIRNSIKALSDPLTSPTKTITAVSLITMLYLLWFLYKQRLPAIFNAYIAVVLLLMLLPKTVTARPRFLFTAFPLLIAAAAWLEHHRREWWPYIIGACSAGLVGLTALYGVRGAIP